MGETLCQNGGLSLFYTVAIQLPYTRHTEKETLCQNGGLSLFYTAAIYKAYREGDSLSEWRPLSFPYSCHIQGIQRRRLSVRMEASLFSIQLLSLFHTAAIYKPYREGDSLSEWRPPHKQSKTLPEQWFPEGKPTKLKK